LVFWLAVYDGLAGSGNDLKRRFMQTVHVEIAVQGKDLSDSQRFGRQPGGVR